MTELTAVGIDYTKVAPLQQKRVHSFLTQYVSETVSYLNRLSTACEQQLEASGLELRRLDATLAVLESKLASLPADLQPAPAAAAAAAGAAASPADAAAAAPAAAAAATAAAAEEPENAASSAATAASTEPQLRVADHPLYAGFFKMLKVGVPIPAIKAKMQASGVNPAALDLDPDSPAAAIEPAGGGGGAAAAAAASSAAAAASASDSGSDFTDSD